MVENNEITIRIKAIEDVSKTLDNLSQKMSSFATSAVAPMDTAMKGMNKTSIQTSKVLADGSKQITRTVNTYKKAARPLTSISDVLNSSLAKRQSFDFSVPLLATAESAKVAGKEIAKSLRMIKPTSVDGTIKSYDDFIAASEAAGLSTKKMASFMRKENLEFNENGEIISSLNGQFQKYGNVLQKASRDARRFKFEYLGIMFAGMALDRVFGGLIRSQLQLFGVTDLMSNAWTVVLLPIIQALLPFLLKMVTLFMEMPEPMKVAVGVFILLGAVVGKFLLIIGQLALGLGAIKGLLGKSLGQAALAGGKAILAAFAGLAAPILVIGAIIIAAVIGIFLAWKENFLNIRRFVGNVVEGLKQFFSGLLGFLKGILNIIKGVFTGDFELIKKGVIQVFKGIWDAFWGLGKAAINAVIALFIGLIKVVKNVLTVIWDAIKFIGKSIGKLFGGGGRIEVGGVLGSFQTGGMIPQTGPYLLHAGEQVIPKKDVGSNSTVNFAPTVNVNANTNANADDIARTVSEELNRQWSYKFQRSTIR